MAKTKILKTKVVGAKVTEQEYDKISAVAEKRDKSVSQLVRERLLAEQLPSLFEQGGNIGRIKELESKINNQKEIIQKQDEKIQSLYVVINDCNKSERSKIDRFESDLERYEESKKETKRIVSQLVLRNKTLNEYIEKEDCKSIINLSKLISDEIIKLKNHFGINFKVI